MIKLDNLINNTLMFHSGLNKEVVVMSYKEQPEGFKITIREQDSSPYIISIDRGRIDKWCDGFKGWKEKEKTRLGSLVSEMSDKSIYKNGNSPVDFDEKEYEEQLKPPAKIHTESPVTIIVTPVNNIEDLKSDLLKSLAEIKSGIYDLDKIKMQISATNAVINVLRTEIIYKKLIKDGGIGRIDFMEKKQLSQ